MKSRVVFLPVPQNLAELLNAAEPDDFFIDPDIPIPVEVFGDGEDSRENFPIENLSI